MTGWVNTQTGEVVEGDCPRCADTRAETDGILTQMERARRADLAKITRLQKQLESQTIATANKADWERAVQEWLLVFPDVPKPRSLSVKSARAQEFFARQDRGALLEDILNAIHGAKQRPYLRYGRRVENAGPNTERGVDLADIVKITGTHSDANFDLLCELGAKTRSEF